LIAPAKEETQMVQKWRAFEDIKETIEGKGWEFRPVGRDNEEATPIMAESGDYCVSFFRRDPGTGECWFELCDRLRRKVVFVRDTKHIPTPEQTAILLEHHSVQLYELAAPRNRPLYSLPVLPVLAA
jgi:hypothetical protein